MATIVEGDGKFLLGVAGIRDGHFEPEIADFLSFIMMISITIVIVTIF